MVNSHIPQAVCLIVFNKDTKELLLVGRKEGPSFLGLPGGKVDEGETLTQALVREVKEETSLEILESDLEFLYAEVDEADVNKTVVTTYVYNKPALEIPEGFISKEGFPVIYRHFWTICNPKIAPFYEYNIKMLSVFVEKYYEDPYWPER